MWKLIGRGERVSWVGVVMESPLADSSPATVSLLNNHNNLFSLSLYWDFTVEDVAMDVIGVGLPKVGDQAGCNIGTDILTGLVGCEGMVAEMEVGMSEKQAATWPCQVKVKRLLSWVLLVLIPVLKGCYGINGRLVVA
jgi:hypothetical protein